jgi:hypothetical protein
MREAAETAVVVSRKRTCEMLNIGASYELLLEKRGELVSIIDGKHRLVLVSSIYARLRRLAALSHPADGPAAKVRQPSRRFAKKPRARTEAELEGLRRGNERRRLEAQARRDAAAAKGAENTT